MFNKDEIKPLELFNFSSKRYHYFEALNATFFDSENIISKKYKAIKINNHNDSNNNNDDIDGQLIEESFKILLNITLKSDYLIYLKIEYTLSQPNDLNDLLDNYYSIIFPYYLFLLKNDANDDLCYLLLDNVNFSINIFEKNSLKNSFEINTVLDIVLFLNQIELEILNYKEKIQIIPCINAHIELIYSLLIYMVILKKKQDKYKNELKKVNEINQNLQKRNIQTIDEKDLGNYYSINKFDISQLKILSNDCFVPNGMMVAIYISFEMNKDSKDRFLLLGRRYIYLYKSEYLKELINIIPIVSGYTIIDLEDIYQRIRIRAGNKDYSFYIYKKEEYDEFRNKLFDIIEGNCEAIVNNDDIIKCSKAFYNDKVFGGMFENTPFYEKNQRDIKNLENKYNELKNIKDEMEKECFMNEYIKNKIEEK